MSLLQRYQSTRNYTLALFKPLSLEDHLAQPIVDVSPPKWHLGHTTWFFETFVLKTYKPNYKAYNPKFNFFFNSYYETIGPRVLRHERGNMTRPSVEEVYAYRTYVDAEMELLLKSNYNKTLEPILNLGLQHEQQHQELFLTDIKYILGTQAFKPAYHTTFKENIIETQKQDWISIKEGLYTIGHQGDDFCFDNELGQHKVYLNNFNISNKLVTNGEFLDFIEDGGYQNFNFWHSEGWDWIKENNIQHPLYWEKIEHQWHQYTLGGFAPININAPVSHISYYEAFAYAEWKGLRIPTEFEWEIAAQHFEWGKRWEWTNSAYLPYPNFKKAKGAVGEYNGKFMVNQMVLRGASVATSPSHSRVTYRNFFHPQLRWQFTGLRLAQ